VLARWLHANGPRADEELVEVNCAALSRDLLETELFGHEKGAFTGAAYAKTGLLEVAHRGTVFLDEIGDMDLAVQPRLLKAIEDKRIRRLGEVRERHVDFRLIAATHQDLDRLSREGRFRRDLYYRINAITLFVPPLRERPEDIPLLARQLLERSAREAGRPRIVLAEETLAALRAHTWPGNVRELRNVLERALLVCDHETIEVPDLRFSLGAPPPEPTLAEASLNLEEMELRAIEASLRLEHGRVEEAARRLGISRSALYLKIKKLGLKPSRT
jgi:transcriptional regulator with PAS, ATPase and Fis domain